jgi:RNA polymerase sigma-70 factor (ECF subfamily)
VIDREAVRNLPDKDIIIHINKGNADAFRYLVERYQDRVASVVIGMIGYGQDAEDIGQETFISAFKSLRKFRFRSEFSTYLVRIAINVCLDELRHRKRQSELSREEHHMIIPERTTDHTDYEIRDAVNRALLELDDGQRLVVILRLMEGYSTRETSMILGIPGGTVLSRLSRAQKKLQEILKYLVE